VPQATQDAAVLATTGEEVAMDIGKIVREVVIEPIEDELPANEPSAPQPSEPEKEPAPAR